MRVRPFHTCLICLCVIICYSTALEANMKEPSCEELRAMWRFSKRQSRAAEITNEIPTYRDPFAFNVWDEYARPRSAGRGGRFKKPPVYGTLISGAAHSRPEQIENSPERVRAFEEVMRLFGSSPLSWPGAGSSEAAAAAPPRRTSFRYGGRSGGGGGGGGSFPHPQSGSFQHLKALIRYERARELQEARLAEEAEEAGGGRDRLGNAGPPGAGVGEKPVAAAAQGKGVVAFPDILLPSLKYLDDYIGGTTPQTQKYRHKHPDTNTI